MVLDSLKHSTINKPMRPNTCCAYAHRVIMPTFELVTSVCSSSFCIFSITSQARSTLCHLYYNYCCYPLRAIKIALNLIMINNNQGNAFIIPERFLFPLFTSAKRKRTLPAVLPYIQCSCTLLYFAHQSSRPWSSIVLHLLNLYFGSGAMASQPITALASLFQQRRTSNVRSFQKTSYKVCLPDVSSSFYHGHLRLQANCHI